MVSFGESSMLPEQLNWQRKQLESALIIAGLGDHPLDVPALSRVQYHGHAGALFLSCVLT